MFSLVSDADAALADVAVAAAVAVAADVAVLLAVDNCRNDRL